MKRLTTLFCLLIFTLNMSSQTTHPKLDSLIDATIKKYDIPSMAISYIRPDTIIYGIKGKAYKESNTRVALKDKYHLGSNTKAITSYIAFGLIEKGLISLETKFTDLVTGLGKIKPQYDDITLADLLSHNARVRPYTSGMEFKKLPEFMGSTMEKREQFAKHILKKSLLKKIHILMPDLPWRL